MLEKLRFGIIGSGKIVDWFLAGASEDSRFEAVAICSRTEERAQEFAAAHQLKYTFTSLEEMASSPLIDAVYIATPNSTHAAYAVLCMNHGKHVLCEKPLASNEREAQLMIDAARRNNVCLMEAMIATMNPNFDVVRNNLPRLGTLRRYVASYCQYSSRYDKLKAGEVLNAFKLELSNGAVMDIGVYTIYPMIALFGEPQKIDASGVLLSTGVDGQGAVNFQYPGMNATILYSKIANSHLPSELEGESGNMLLDSVHVIRKVTFIPRGAANSGRGPATEPVELGVPLNHDEYYFELKHFIDLVEQGRIESDVNTHLNSLLTLRVIDEIRRQLGVVYPADAE